MPILQAEQSRTHSVLLHLSTRLPFGAKQIACRWTKAEKTMRELQKEIQDLWGDAVADARYEINGTPATADDHIPQNGVIRMKAKQGRSAH